MIAWFCSDGVLNFQKGLLVFVSHVKISVQYFIFSIAAADFFFFFIWLQSTHKCMCKNPQTSSFLFPVSHSCLEINFSVS